MKLDYKGVVFNKFNFIPYDLKNKNKFLNETDGNVTLDQLDLGYSYICPDCALENGFTKETDYSRKQLKELSTTFDENYHAEGFVCCVDGCNNDEDAVEISFNLKRCKLI